MVVNDLLHLGRVGSTTPCVPSNPWFLPGAETLLLLRHPRSCLTAPTPRLPRRCAHPGNLGGAAHTPVLLPGQLLSCKTRLESHTEVQVQRRKGTDTGPAVGPGCLCITPPVPQPNSDLEVPLLGSCAKVATYLRMKARGGGRCGSPFLGGPEGCALWEAHPPASHPREPLKRPLVQTPWQGGEAELVWSVSLCHVGCAHVPHAPQQGLGASVLVWGGHRPNQPRPRPRGLAKPRETDL